jgi:SAM-dependent methyltransferase
MKYDPVKEIFSHLVRRRPWMRRLLYRLLSVIFLREWYVKRAVRGLLQNTGGSVEIYDAGMGFGQYTYYMARRFPDVRIHAADVKAEQVEDCRQFFAAMGLRHCSVAVEDLLTIRHENRFDLVLSVDVMEHIAEDRRVFTNLARSLKPGGVLLVNTPSNLGGSDVHGEGEQSFIEEHARAGYGVEEIREKVESAGLRVESITFTYGPLGTLAWRLGVKYPMLLLNKSRLLVLVLPLYYMLALPIILPLMYLDYVSTNKSGTGLLVVARKPSSSVR